MLFIHIYLYLYGKSSNVFSFLGWFLSEFLTKKQRNVFCFVLQLCICTTEEQNGDKQCRRVLNKTYLLRFLWDSVIRTFLSSRYREDVAGMRILWPTSGKDQLGLMALLRGEERKCEHGFPPVFSKLSYI